MSITSVFPLLNRKVFKGLLLRLFEVAFRSRYSFPLLLSASFMLFNLRVRLELDIEARVQHQEDQDTDNEDVDILLEVEEIDT